MIFKTRRRNKRGSLQDLIVVMAILLALGITIILGSLVMREISVSGLLDDRNGVDQIRARLIFNQSLNRVVPQFDNIFVAVVVAGILGTVVLGFATRSLPVFFVAGFVFTIVLVLLAGIYSNIYDAVADHPRLIADSENFTAMEFIFANFPLVILGGAVIVAVTIYGLSRIGV